MIGYLFALVSMVSIGAIGLLSKLSDRKGCSPLTTTLVAFGGATLIMAFHVGLFKQANFFPPRKILGMAVFFGMLAVLAFWVFLYGLRFGKISTSWVFMNLSAVVPAVLSTVIYKEKVGFRKLVVVSLVIVSILLLWKDMKERSEPSERL
jgi:drug/metabolite transporter (DMT)-like permease